MLYLFMRVFVFGIFWTQKCYVYFVSSQKCFVFIAVITWGTCSKDHYLIYYLFYANQLPKHVVSPSDVRSYWKPTNSSSWSHDEETHRTWNEMHATHLTALMFSITFPKRDQRKHNTDPSLYHDSNLSSRICFQKIYMSLENKLSFTVRGIQIFWKEITVCF